MTDDDDDFREFVQSARRLGFQGCIDYVAHQLLPALVFPRIYREFLRQECCAALASDTDEGRLLLKWIGWDTEYYKGSRDSDDEAIDGPFGPQQLTRKFVLPLWHVFPDRKGEIQLRVLRRILHSLGVPNERDESEARRVMLADAEAQLARPAPHDADVANPVVRALADMTAAELGLVIPWNEQSSTGLGISSPNVDLGVMGFDGTVVVPRRDRHDVNDRAGFAGDMLEHMCWLPFAGATHVPVKQILEDWLQKYFATRPHLHDRQHGVVSSLMAIQLQWTERHIERVEIALKGRRMPYELSHIDMHVSVLARIAQGRSARSPRGGWDSVPHQTLAKQEIQARCAQKSIGERVAARELIELHLVQAAMIRDDWEAVLQEEMPEEHAAIAAVVKRALDRPLGVEVQPMVAALIEAEGLPSIGRLRQPVWVSGLGEEASRQYHDAESAFVDRVNWQPTPRVPEAPKSWATVLSGYARAVESELLFAFFDPAIERFAADVCTWPDEKLRSIRDPEAGGRRSEGAQFARFILSRRSKAGVEGGRSPCLGEMHYLLSQRPRYMGGDAGLELLRSLRRTVIGGCWELGVRRNAAILDGINRFRVDSSHARRADSAREVTRDQALLGRRVMVHYLQFLVELRRGGD
jgi:hypothetical protein